MMTATFEKDALDLLKPPFRYGSGYIFDRDGNMVADQTGYVLRVRGWGRMSYMGSPQKLQDAAGELMAKALTKFWNDELLSETSTER